jgi:hypothetical protein
MYRVIAIVCAGLFVAACESAPDWMKAPDLSGFKFGEPPTETVRFESEPPGAEAKASTGQSCRTPCSLDLPAKAETTISFALAGYQPDTEKLELVSMGDGTSQLRPNPVLVELTPAPPPPKPIKKKPAPRKKTAAKPTTPATPQPAAAPPPQAPSPWPTTPQR